MQAVVARLDGRDLGAEQDILVATLDQLVERFHEVRIGARDDLLEDFHDGDPGPQGEEDRGQLEPDDAGADHEQAFGDVLECKRSGRVHHARIVMRKAREPHGPSA